MSGISLTDFGNGIANGMVESHCPTVAATSDDVFFLYRILLGREPESDEVIRDKTRKTTRENIVGTLDSFEFKHQVLFPLRHGDALPHDRRSARPTVQDAAWIRDCVPIGPATFDQLQFAGSWREFLLFLLADEAFSAAACIGVPNFSAIDQRMAFAIASPRPRSQHTACQAGIDLAVRVSDAIVLLAGWIADPAEDIVGLALRTGGSTYPLARELVRYSRPDVAQTFGVLDGPSLDCGFIAVFSLGSEMAADSVQLILRTTTDSLLVAAPLGDTRKNLAYLLASLSGLFDPETRLVVFERLADAGFLGELPEPDARRLLSAWNSAVANCRTSLEDAASGVTIHIDIVLRLSGVGVLLRGWRFADQAALENVVLVQVGGEVTRISDRWAVVERADVNIYARESGIASDPDELGFVCFVPSQRDRPDCALYLVATLANGRSRRLRLVSTPQPSGALATVRRILAELPDTDRHLLSVLDTQLGPAVRMVWHRRPVVVGEVGERQYGEQIPAPDVSVIVPIYGRYDFIEFQIALFVNDPAMRRHELLYVVDDPSIYHQVQRFCGEIAPFYDFPFRSIYSRRNLGFAGAVNLGAGRARGNKLLLLNSDVFPRDSGWLSHLVQRYDELPAAGAVAPKLLFEDGSIQHAGITFERYPPWGGMWINDHPLKGQPDDPTRRDPIALPAVTAACLMIDRQLYERVGGLSEDYIIGDFEDTDLCLKLLAAGRRNWVVPDIALYHLERQSQGFGVDPSWRRNLTLYNCWLHHGRWNHVIGELQSRRSEVRAE